MEKEPLVSHDTIKKEKMGAGGEKGKSISFQILLPFRAWMITLFSLILMQPS